MTEYKDPKGGKKASQSTFGQRCTSIGAIIGHQVNKRPKVAAKQIKNPVSELKLRRAPEKLDWRPPSSHKSQH